MSVTKYTFKRIDENAILGLANPPCHCYNQRAIFGRGETRRSRFSHQHRRDESASLSRRNPADGGWRALIIDAYLLNLVIYAPRVCTTVGFSPLDFAQLIERLTQGVPRDEFNGHSTRTPAVIYVTSGSHDETRYYVMNTRATQFFFISLSLFDLRPLMI